MWKRAGLTVLDLPFHHLRCKLWSFSLASGTFTGWTIPLAWNLSLDPEHPCKRLGVVAHVCNPALGRVEAGGSLELNQPSQSVSFSFIERTCLKNEIENQWDDSLGKSASCSQSWWLVFDSWIVETHMVEEERSLRKTVLVLWLPHVLHTHHTP